MKGIINSHQHPAELQKFTELSQRGLLSLHNYFNVCIVLQASIHFQKPLVNTQETHRP